MFCYYSLISQWLAYETSPYTDDKNRWHRRYNTHNYVCYICGITTYRKRVCTISVKDFPFLLEHSRPPGALTVLNGECVVTCQTCFESITSQWKDFERMKVPVEMRKYNWIVMPPPPDDENSRGCQILVPDSSGPAPADGSEPATSEDSSVPSGGVKPPPPHLAYALTKSVGRNVISPVPHSNTAFSPFATNLNPALNATRTSSFAAALRKLAKQAVDPIAEKELSPISPASSPGQQSRHHAVYLNSHNSNPSAHRVSPPVVTVTPMHTSQGKALDLGRYSSSSRNGNLTEPVSLKVENSKCIDKRSELGGNKDQMSLRHEHNVPSRGFQPYRNSDEQHSTPSQVYPSPPPTTVAAYPYHPSFAQSTLQSYRLEDSVYMERYGLLRPSAMPYPSNIISHPRAPLYPTSHYPPELLTRPAPSNYPARYPRDDEHLESSMLKKHEMDSYREHERYLERKEEYREREAEYLRKERHMHHSPVLHRPELPPEDKGHMGSITHGTPRDYIRQMTPPPPVSVPLNLAANSEGDLEEEMRLKFRVNGQMHHPRMLYRKENEPSSYKLAYQMNSESHSKPPVSTESSKPMPSFYVEREFPKSSEQVETRTLSMASVINSQINGIFAREKFVSNNSYDYLNSFADKNIFADNPPTKQEDRTKLPSFLIADPPILKPQEPSITRALLQNTEIHQKSEEDPSSKVESVLDKREKRLRDMRQAGEMLDSDYSDPDSDSEDAERFQRLLKITKGPPPKFELNLKKMQFLSNFGLVTYSIKEKIELKKCIRRHKALREKSCSPTVEEPKKAAAVEYDFRHLTELSNRLCFDEKFEEKAEFLKMLGLKYNTAEEKAEKENIMKVVENERLRRNDIIGPSQRCLELQGSHLRKRASSAEMSPSEPEAKKLNTNVCPENVKQEESLPSTKFVARKNPAPLKPSSVPRLSAFLKPPFRSANLPVPPLIPASQVNPSSTEPVVATKDPRVRQLHKEFAQEFHNSVLQTTQMQLEKKQVPSSVPVEVPPPAVEEENRSSFRWPGIEAVMESYECHISEQNVEKTFLLSNCQNLNTCIQESNAEIECLGRKTEELVRYQKCLEAEKRELQTKLEALGLFLQHFR